MSIVNGIISFFLRSFAILGVLAAVCVYLVFDFISRSDPHIADADLPETAVVFTGDFDRIHLGLEMLKSGKVDRLFITGVNGDAGLDVARFARQFDLGSEQTNWIVEGKIVLAPDAHSTFENARETACWLDTQQDITSVALITSRRHMARASVALQHGISPISVVRVVTDANEDYDALQIDLVDFGQFATTWFITFFPFNLWPGNEPSLCKVL